MGIKVVCERCGRAMGTVTLKNFRDWTKGEICGVCLKRDEDLLAFYADKKASYFNKMNLLVNDFKDEMNDQVKKLATPKSPGSGSKKS
jgi:hypothetical protein